MKKISVELSKIQQLITDMYREKLIVLVDSGCNFHNLTCFLAKLKQKLFENLFLS